jgi:hypothetical protein
MYHFTSQQRIADYMNGRFGREELLHRLRQICFFDRGVSTIRDQYDMAIAGWSIFQLR